MLCSSADVLIFSCPSHLLGFCSSLDVLLTCSCSAHLLMFCSSPDSGMGYSPGTTAIPWIFQQKTSLIWNNSSTSTYYLLWMKKFLNFFRNVQSSLFFWQVLIPLSCHSYSPMAPRLSGSSNQLSWQLTPCVSPTHCGSNNFYSSSISSQALFYSETLTQLISFQIKSCLA